MQINQVNFNYISVEDRLMMRINTSDKAEFRFWLTRAVVIRMVDGLTKSEGLLIAPEVPETSNPSVKEKLQEFWREASVAGADYKSEFAANAASYPLGDTPLLVANFAVRNEADHAVVAFTLANNQVVTINFGAQLVVSVNKLLRDVVGKLSWNLPLSSTALPVRAAADSAMLH